MIRSSILALLPLCLTACISSPPTHFYTLDPVAPTATPAVSSRLAPPLVVTVALPETLDRPELVRTAGADSLDIQSLDRWAAPLEDITRRTLVRDLAMRLPGRVIEDGSSGTADILIVDVDSFAASTAGQVVLEGYWSLSPGGAAPGNLLRTPFRVTTDVAGASPAAAPPAMAAALASLADQLAHALQD